MEKSKSLKYYFLFSFYFIIFGMVVAALTSYVNYSMTVVNIKKQITRNVNSIFDEKAFYTNQIMKRYVLLLNTFSKNSLLIDYIENPAFHNKEHLDAFFLASVESTFNLMQLRYIDEKGVERSRVDRKSGRVFIVPENKLQDKSDSYYFKESAKLPENSIWKSKVDLNREHGKIEIPLNPTFRMATPVYINGNFKGIVIVNLMMSNVLNNLVKADNFDVFICDGKGRMLLTTGENQIWSGYLNKHVTLKNYLPEYADKILANDVFSTENLYSFNLEPQIQNGENIRLVFKTKQEYILETRADNTYAAFIIALTTLAVSIPLAWIAAFIPSRLQTKLTETNRSLREFMNILDRYVITTSTDVNQIITRVSLAFSRISGYSREELIGNTNKLIRHPENDPAIYKELWETIQCGDVWQGELRCQDKHGNTFWLRKIISPDLNEKGEIIGYTSIDYDFTAIKQIEEMSVTDQLTKISNRRWLDASLKKEMVRFERYGHDFSVILLDIDHFKNVNDNFGHAEGDSVLIQLAAILKSSTRASDTVGRWGGEEFLIVAPETLKDDCVVLAEKIRRAVEEHDFGVVGHITISLGVAQYESGSTAAHFIINADNALYRAKQGGRNRTEKA
ncbi:GGDEF domain-containing protein [Seleniivibrio woodruffii]|uniref:sensor domain-containing diguanylate cyclase n=1 Tax=Seleniivibrio woodruffii TaxID=1078050 RepID=UPI0039E4CC87